MTPAEKTRTYYDELWNKRDFGVIADWIAPGFVGHYSALPEPVHGPDGFRRLAEDLFAAFPDLTMDVKETVEQDGRVASRVEMRGTHRGELQGFAPTGLPVTGTFIAIEHYVDGLVVEEWANADDLAMSRQIRAIPEPGSRAERVGQALYRLRAGRLRRTS